MIYLDNAATSHPKPACVAKAMLTALTHGGNPGRSGHPMAVEAGQVIVECRENLCRFLHVEDPFRFIFVYNCTDALNLGILGMVHPGDHVVTTMLEHNSVLRPLAALVSQKVITWTIVKPDSQGVVTSDLIMAAIEPNTRLVVVTHASNVTGVVNPIESIAMVCHNMGIPLMVDGAQAVGCIPVRLDTLGADLYAFPGHKGLLGPQGTGVLYIAPDCHPQPHRRGGTGSSSQSLEQPEDLPDLYESGTPATPAIAGLSAGVSYLMQHGDKIMSEEQTMKQWLLEGLRSLPGVKVHHPPESVPSVALVSFSVDGMDSAQVADILIREYHIACRSGLHCAPLVHKWLGTDVSGAVRLSLGAFTKPQEIRLAILAMARIVQTK